MASSSARASWYLLSGASSFGDTLVWVLAPVYFVTVVGMSPLQLVLVGTFMELTVFLFEVPTGIVADVYSRRLSVVIRRLHASIRPGSVACASAAMAMSTSAKRWKSW